jgi:uncharacterized protein
MIRLPSRFRRLDDALAGLPGEDEPMLLSELDGYLTSVIVCPEPVTPGEWLPLIWGGGDAPPFDDPADVGWFADMVMARHKEISRDLDRGKPQPIFDIDERNGETLWEPWIEGFALGMESRPDSWPIVFPSAGTEDLDALASMRLLVKVARNENELTSVQINDFCDDAPRLISRNVAQLYAPLSRAIGAASAGPAQPAKAGRNDLCPCGSGKKHKRCCG